MANIINSVISGGGGGGTVDYNPPMPPKLYGDYFPKVTEDFTLASLGVTLPTNTTQTSIRGKNARTNFIASWDTDKYALFCYYTAFVQYIYSTSPVGQGSSFHLFDMSYAWNILIPKCARQSTSSGPSYNNFVNKNNGSNYYTNYANSKVTGWADSNNTKGMATNSYGLRIYNYNGAWASNTIVGLPSQVGLSWTNGNYMPSASTQKLDYNNTIIHTTAEWFLVDKSAIIDDIGCNWTKAQNDLSTFFDDTKLPS